MVLRHFPWQFFKILCLMKLALFFLFLFYFTLLQEKFKIA